MLPLREEWGRLDAVSCRLDLLHLFASYAVLWHMPSGISLGVLQKSLMDCDTPSHEHPTDVTSLGWRVLQLDQFL